MVYFSNGPYSYSQLSEFMLLCLFLEQPGATPGRKKCSRAFFLFHPRSGPIARLFLFAWHNLKFMSSRIVYARPFSPLSLALYLSSRITSLSSPQSCFSPTDVVSPQNLNIKIRRALMPPTSSLLPPLALFSYVNATEILFAKDVFIKYAQLRELSVKLSAVFAHEEDSRRIKITTFLLVTDASRTCRA